MPHPVYVYGSEARPIKVEHELNITKPKLTWSDAHI